MLIREPRLQGPHRRLRLGYSTTLVIISVTVSFCSGCITTYSFGPGTRTNPTPMDRLPQVARVQVVGNRVHVEGSERLANCGPVLEAKEIAKGERFATVGINGRCDYRYIETRNDQIILDRRDRTGGCAAFFIFAFFHEQFDTIAIRPYDLQKSAPPKPASEMGD